MLIDTHCHLTYEGLAENPAGVLAQAAAAGVTCCITVGTHLADHPKALALARCFPTVFVALGIHPHHAAETEDGYEGFLENQLKNEPKALALGECGLDYHYDYSPRLLQRSTWISQLEIARRLKLPVILHVREAHQDALAVMADFPDLRCVVHCFTGTPAEATQWLDRGAYLGLTGIVTYKNAADLQQAAQLIPADRLLLETDAPYLSPEPVRSAKPCQPAFLTHTAQFLATLRRIPVEDLAHQTTANAARLFGDGLLA